MVEDEILKSNITLVKTGYQNSYIGAEDCNFLQYGFYFIFFFLCRECQGDQDLLDLR